MAPNRLPSPVIHGVGSRPTGDRTRHHFQLNIKVTRVRVFGCADLEGSVDARPPLSGALPLTYTTHASQDASAIRHTAIEVTWDRSMTTSAQMPSAASLAFYQLPSSSVRSLRPVLLSSHSHSDQLPAASCWTTRTVHGHRRHSKSFAS